MRIITTYEPVTLTGRKSVKCSDCGKNLRRQRTFQQTLNPWNRNTAGRPKSRREINIQLQKRVADWQTEPETCQGCQA